MTIQPKLHNLLPAVEAASPGRNQSFFRRALYRAYTDLCLPNRLWEYRDLLQRAKELGYRIHSVYSFWQMLNQKGLAAGQKYLVLRHDVDTASNSARKMWDIDLELNIRSSYYFRLTTMDTTLLKEMDTAGFEASYHYEELSTIIKTKGIEEPHQAIQELPRARAAFKNTLKRLRSLTGLPMRTVAAHGDFVNRRLKVSNTMILEDEKFREDVDIDAEAYDDVIATPVVGSYSDVTREYPRRWRSQHPLVGLNSGEPVVHLLVHPEGWSRNSTRNVADDLSRVWQELAYGYAIRKRRLAQDEVTRSSAQ